MSKQAEFRGCDNFVCARVLKDDKEGYSTDTVISVAPIASVAKTSEVSNETHFYDNTGMIQVKAVGTDTVTFIVPAMFLEKLALVTGATIDPLTGAYMSGEDSDYEYAVGYRLKLTDGSYRYVWRLKGTFSGVPDESSNTENNSVDTQNQQVVFTGTKTIYEFTTNNVGQRRDVVMDERDGKCDFEHFFDTVQTPDTVSNLLKATTTAISLSNSTASVTVGNTTTITATTTPASQGVSWTTSNPAVATVAGGVITGVGAGTALITATSGMQSAGCTVTVTAGA